MGPPCDGDDATDRGFPTWCFVEGTECGRGSGNWDYCKSPTTAGAVTESPTGLELELGGYCKQEVAPGNPCAADRSDDCCDCECTYCAPSGFCEDHSPFKSSCGTCNPDYSGGEICRNYFRPCAGA